MPEAGFPKPVGEIVSTLIDIYRHQHRSDIVELLEHASAHFDDINYDNWNGGITTWALRLETPIPIFAAVEPNLNALEKEIHSKLGYWNRQTESDPIGQVTIAPIAPGKPAVGQRIVPPESEVRRLWPDGRLRLFLSHVAAHKIAVSKLKGELAGRGVAAFVAHEDIEPSQEWLKEIELALRSMHALVALVTPEFHASRWTDQEVGWALGRGIPVISVRLGADPYGFAGKVQGVSGSWENLPSLAGSLVEVLLNHSQTHIEMRRSLASAFCASRSYIVAQTLRKIIVNITDFSLEEKHAMLKACSENQNVKGAHFVPEAIEKAFRP